MQSEKIYGGESAPSWDGRLTSHRLSSRLVDLARRQLRSAVGCGYMLRRAAFTSATKANCMRDCDTRRGLCSLTGISVDSVSHGTRAARNLNDSNKRSHATAIAASRAVDDGK